MAMNQFTRARLSKEIESRIRFYPARFPTVLARAKNETIWDVSGRAYIDFFSAAGSLNYGHNNERMKSALLQYISGDGLVTSLDIMTAAKEEFIQKFDDHQRARLGQSYRLMFTGPTGANAVEAAFKLARRVTGRWHIGAFTNSFHGMSLGALSASSSKRVRKAAGLPLAGVHRYPFEGYFCPEVNTLHLIERELADPESGYDLPAAFILETVQGEGGLNTASPGWLCGLLSLCRKHDILLIIDDIQAGCGRTGEFFSFETADIRPDIVCLSKSLSGFGLPLSMVMVRDNCDQLESGEHNGTFRGNNHAFITASVALDLWAEEAFNRNHRAIAAIVSDALNRLAGAYDLEVPRGRGLMRGIRIMDAKAADAICMVAFEAGLLMETCGSLGDVIKIMPPLTADPARIREGLAILERSIGVELERRASAATAVIRADDGADITRDGHNHVVRLA